MQDPSVIRLTFFVATFIACALWENRRPRKQLTQNRSVRWFNNLALIVLNNACVLLLPVVAFQAAILVNEQNIGLMNALDLPFWFEILITVLLLDLAIYLQHLVFHRIPLLWKLHRVHHADQDIDVTTAARFHPIEIILSMFIKIGCVYALGVDPIAVVVFEVLLSSSAMFNHSNGWLPLNIDEKLRKVIVTPDMHRVHHSIIIRETHSNFGFFLSVWDRLFRTYRAQPELGHDGCTIGINQFRDAREQYIGKMLTQPFREN